MRPSTLFYKVCYCLARVGLGIFYWLDVKGRENIPQGAAIICANHSSMVDPFFIAFACGINSRLHIISKAELFRIPILSTILKKLDMISVDRGTLDIKTIKRTLGYLNNDEKIGIFPEGTRSAEDDAIAPKTGAVRIAEHANVAVVPAFIPRKKSIFRRIRVVIGKPYYIEKTKVKRTHEDYVKQARKLMDSISELAPKDLKVKSAG